MKTKFYSSLWCALFIFNMQNLHTQNTTADGLSKQIRVTLGNKTPLPSQSEKTFNNLEQLAVDMTLKANELRAESKKSGADLKTRLLAEATMLENLSVQLQIDALELSGKKHAELFLLNAQTIRTMFLNYVLSRDAAANAGNLSTLAEHDMKLAREMREEAAAEQKPGPRLGRMSNANDKEIVALDEQHQAMKVMQKNNSAAMSMR